MLPDLPRFCGQTFLEAKDRELASRVSQAYNDWMVEEWCGDSGGRLVPLVIVPLWDAELAAAEIRRNAERGVHAVTFCEIPPTSAFRPSTPASGIRSSRVRRDRHGRSTCTWVRRRRCPPPSGRAARGRAHPHASATRWRRSPTGSSAASSCSTRASSWRTARARSAGCPTCSSEPTTSGCSTGRGPVSATRCRNPRAPTTTGRSTGASSATDTASRR